MIFLGTVIQILCRTKYAQDVFAYCISVIYFIVYKRIADQVNNDNKKQYAYVLSKEMVSTCHKAMARIKTQKGLSIPERDTSVIEEKEAIKYFVQVLFDLHLNLANHEETKTS